MEHPNYCRSFLKNAAEMMDVLTRGRITKEKALAVYGALDQARSSQKFALPPGGLLLDDPEHRALDETQELRLPFPNVALEYWREAATYSSMGPARRRILLCREESGAVVITAVAFVEAAGLWAVIGDAKVPRSGYLRRDGRAACEFTLAVGFDANLEQWIADAAVVLGFLNALQCRNVEIARSEPRSSGKKAKTAIPFDVYRTLTVEISRREAGSAGGGAEHRSPREHLRRGHIVRPGNGRRPYWRNATVVNPGQAGRVEKDYRIAKDGSFTP